MPIRKSHFKRVIADFKEFNSSRTKQKVMMLKYPKIALSPSGSYRVKMAETDEVLYEGQSWHVARLIFNVLTNFINSGGVWDDC